MKGFEIKINYVDYNEDNGKRKIIKNCIDEFWQLYEFEMMSIRDDYRPFFDHLHKWFIIKPVSEIIKEDNKNERKSNRNRK